MASGDERSRSGIKVARVVTDADGNAVFDGDPEAIAEVQDAMARARARDERRRETWGEIGPASMTRLAHRFPGLRGAPGVDPWDAITLLRWACGGRSHGEVLAAKFVLSVWNTSTDWEEIARDEGILTTPEGRFSRFDLFEAMAVWDAAHVEAMLAWLQLPFWP